ncbi:hypothetical protein GCM10011579_063390 [Streptomyces albiflavescens]|uniref:Uncharacterized protein n=1 Tax=Streptomyces albiflavescens TaxID=1623582 RepID=A0A917YB51_9ACTN|nr:hypothetical protein GCM10011579_063390 [Streptomyces albiflavescens]
MPPCGTRRHVRSGPPKVYTVLVCAKGRQDSRSRYEAAMERDEWGLRAGFEDYVIVFIPAEGQRTSRTTN